VPAIPAEHQEPFTDWVRDDEADEATVEVFADRAAPFALPPTLFGSFIENIGDCVYGGVWAQILRNPSFEPDYLSAFNLSEACRAGRFVTDPTFAYGYVRIEPLMEEPGDRFFRSSAPGLPLPWEPLRPLGARYEMRHGDAANGPRSLLLMGLNEHEVGVRQGVYLPVHRTRRFVGSLWAKAVKLSSGDSGAPDAPPVMLSVGLRRRDRPDEVIAATEILVEKGSGWTRRAFTLDMPDGAIAPLEKADFCVALDRTDARVLLDNVLLWPADHIEGFDPEVIEAARAARIPLLRWGGNFCSGYHWQDGVGPLEARPTILNQAWGLPEYNHFGTNEFVRLCRLIGAEPQICVNAGSGEVDEAAAWVEYCNGDATTTEYGALRASHGYPEPHNVRWWEVGNELWGNFQIGWQTPEGNGRRYKPFADAMRAVDPTIRLIAMGGDPDFYEKWHAALIEHAGADLDLVATHFVIGTFPLDQRPNDSTDAHAHRADFAVPVGTGRVLDKMRAQFEAAGAPTQGRGVGLAFTEWLFWSPRLDVDPCFTNLGGAVCVAGFLHALARRADFVPVSNLSALTWFAGIHRQRGGFFITPSFLVFGLYAEAAGCRPVSVRLRAPGHDITGGNRRLNVIGDTPDVDVLAVDGSGAAAPFRLRVYLVNRRLAEPLPVRLALDGLEAGAAAVTRIRQMSADNLAAANTPEEPNRVGWTDVAPPPGQSPRLRLVLPPHSVTVVDV